MMAELVKRLRLASLLLLAIAPLTPSPAQQAVAPTASPATDPLFSRPYIDIDEWRDAPVRHRYVHGGFTGTDARFSFYFPPPAQYHGRFFQHFTPAPDSENLAQHEAVGAGNKIGFSIASGGYFVETNEGGVANTGGPGFNVDPTISAWRANAAAAKYSRVVAMQMYGGQRPFGYGYGGSGGAYRTVGAFENTTGVWDGVVPYVLGSSNASPSNFTVRMHAMRILKDKFAQIVDAVAPGGSGDPYTGLTKEQADALREVTRMGFPIESWFGYRTMGVHAFPAIYGGMVLADPGYFTDFWTKPGYLGFDHPEAFVGYRLQHQARIAAPITAQQAAGMALNTSVVNGRVDGGVDNSYGSLQGEGARRIVAVRLDMAPPAVDFLGGDLYVLSGPAQGARLTVSRIAGDVAILGIVDPQVAAKLAPGDSVRLDNSNFLAAQTYHRHQVPGPAFVGWDQFRKADGTPIYPQRPFLLGPLFTRGAAGTVPTGRWTGKMILVENLWDREAFAWSADWYRGLVQQNLGSTTDDHFRVWFTDHALHGDSTQQEDPTRTVSYLGELEQALRDLSAWVERGTPPPASTRYRVIDARVTVPATAAQRLGIQPVVTAIANGSPRANIAVGQTVSFTGTITAPPGGGTVVGAAWDFDGAGAFPVASPIGHGARSVTVTVSHRFDKPGTWFPALLGTTQSRDALGTPYARLQNLGRVRVVVR